MAFGIFTFNSLKLEEVACEIIHIFIMSMGIKVKWKGGGNCKEPNVSFFRPSVNRELPVMKNKSWQDAHQSPKKSLNNMSVSQAAFRPFRTGSYWKLKLTLIMHAALGCRGNEMKEKRHKNPPQTSVPPPLQLLRTYSNRSGNKWFSTL